MTTNNTTETWANPSSGSSLANPTGPSIISARGLFKVFGYRGTGGYGGQFD